MSDLAMLPLAGGATWFTTRGRATVTASTDAYALYVATVQLGRDATVELPARHDHQVVYIVDGGVGLAGRVWRKGSAVVIERNLPATIRATVDSRLVVFGRSSQRVDVSDSDEYSIHGLASDDAARFRHSASGGTIDSAYFFDSTCPTCDTVLFEVRMDPGARTGSHRHSADELIYVLNGELYVGRDVVRTGAAVGVEANRRYGVRAGAAGCRFLNYRLGESYFIGREGDAPLLETVESLRAIGGPTD